HDRSVNHAQTFQSMNTAVTINHCHIIFTHFTAAGWMVGGLGMVTHELVNFRISLYLLTRTYFVTAVRIQCRLLHDFTGNPDGITEFAPVLFRAHIVEQDTWMLKRVF